VPSKEELSKLSARALILMLIVCAAMLTIQLFGYFALQTPPF
jgi:hypothetical protein